MLTLMEKIIFIFAVITSGFLAFQGGIRLINTINMGEGKPDWNLVIQRMWNTIIQSITLKRVWRMRPLPSLLHAIIVWGFTYYLIVNIGDLLQAFIPGFVFLGDGWTGDIYRLGADLLSVGVLLSMLGLLIRRFYLHPENLDTRNDILLHDKAKFGIKKDSFIVGAFILLHVGFRFLGESFQLALVETSDSWQPFASVVSTLWSGLSENVLVVMIHASFWVALGLILIFIPYFPYSKHIHLFFAPLNFLLKPERRSIGELKPLDFEDETISQFGASTMKDLSWEQIMDAYACIMCNRCQEVCPAYNTGKVLSPAALEINKRYLLNQIDTKQQEFSSDVKLIDDVIPAEAIWACTTCGACIDICPVGNEPMRDIVDIRRSLILMENSFPDQLQMAFRGMERTNNPWNIPQTERMEWAVGLDVPTITDNPNPEYLWWVGCAPATDSRAQKTTQALAKILNHAKVNYAILGKMETCSGDSARRSGNEYLFFELASTNVAMLNQIKPKKILTTCPHCLHTIMNEYPSFGGQYEVVHHTQLISELFLEGKLFLKEDVSTGKKITFHDPCYLGRQNNVFNEPRMVLQNTGFDLIEMPKNRNDSVCCGAGGGQMWKEEEHGNVAVNKFRFNEAQTTAADSLAVGCPFCKSMLNDAAIDLDSEMQVLDIAEIVAAQLPE